MKNWIQPGDVIDLPAAPYALSSGDGCLQGQLFGVAVADAANGAAVSIRITGVALLKKLSTEVWTVGQKLYWDNTNKQVTGTATGNTFIGHATKAAVNPSTTGNVRLTGAPMTATF